MMKRIAIIGGGFSGTMTAIHLSKKTPNAEIILIGDQENFNRGIAFNPYSKQQLLNVSTARMSAFDSEPDHFLNWVMEQDEFKHVDRSLVAGAFLPRHYFGNYLSNVWYKNQTSTNGCIKIVHDEVIKLDSDSEAIQLTTANGQELKVDYCVIANGNSLPRNPGIPNMDFYSGKNYFQNPWTINSVQHVDAAKPVLIIGNGLTMVDTVIGLLEQGFDNTIYSLSPNGFNILPHRHPGMKYTGLTDELKKTNDITLLNLLKLVNKHVKLVRSYGISAEPVIDSLRPYTQVIWMSFTQAEKRLFISKLRHLWGVARHRIPLHMHDMLQQMRIDRKLNIVAGKLKDIVEINNDVHVYFYNHKKKQEEEIIVSRIINCTGPESNIENLGEHFLNQCLHKGIIEQDALKLGINAHPATFEIIGSDKKINPRLFTLGSNLRGVIWESTAVGELRKQAEQLAQTIASRL
jgi:uncharacterized NAD(P)/FAD-binding protein YdhS